MEAFNNYPLGIRTRMYATGRFNRAYSLQGIESVGHISILDPLDISVRIEELKLLKQGWLDGKGLPPIHDGLDWFAQAFNRDFPLDLPLPYLYPTAEGGLRAEWSNKPHDISLEIDLEARVGSWPALKLDDVKDWEWFADEVRRFVGVNA